MGQHLLGLVLIVFGIMIDSINCMYTTTTTNMDPFDDRVNLWPNGRVPYVISKELDSNSREKINEKNEITGLLLL